MGRPAKWSNEYFASAAACSTRHDSDQRTAQPDRLLRVWGAAQWRFRAGALRRGPAAPRTSSPTAPGGVGAGCGAADGRGTSGGNERLRRAATQTAARHGVPFSRHNSAPAQPQWPVGTAPGGASALRSWARTTEFGTAKPPGRAGPGQRREHGRHDAAVGVDQWAARVTGPDVAAQRGDRAQDVPFAVRVLGADGARLPDPRRLGVERTVERVPEDRRRAARRARSTRASARAPIARRRAAPRRRRADRNSSHLGRLSRTDAADLDRGVGLARDDVGVGDDDARGAGPSRCPRRRARTPFRTRARRSRPEPSARRARRGSRASAPARRRPDRRPTAADQTARAR